MTLRERLILRILLLCGQIVLAKDVVLQTELKHLSNHVGCLRDTTD